MVAGHAAKVLVAVGSILPRQLGVMWGWCRWNMPFYGHARGRISGPAVLGEPRAPSTDGYISAAAPENACCGGLCSHSEAAPIRASTSPVGPLPSASHPGLNTQVCYLGRGYPGAGCRWASTDKGPYLCQVYRNPEWFQGSTVVGWILTQVHVSIPQ